ncbi:MAG: transposase [Chloroflexi bacterium]|nr:transposase [Chloroflexota bacterium]
MNKFTQLSEFLAYLFDDEKAVAKANVITEGILKARSCRISEIAREMPGQEAANYKCIQRFLTQQSLGSTLQRLYQEQADFMIGDPTEMPRPQAKKTGYVGTLHDGETSGYWLLLLATPYQGRALPCHFVSYSSTIIGTEATSRNRYHFQAFAELKELLGDKPLVLDREFSYLELMQALVTEKLNFVIRLKVGAKFLDSEGKAVALSVKKGETRILNKVFYMGQVFVNLIGQWKEGLHEPLWVMTNLPAEQGLSIYLQRMKIEQSFRDLKSLLGFDKMMHKKRHLMEKMVALVLIAYAIGLVLGEALRSQLFPLPQRKHKLFSGLFVLLKLKWSLPYQKFKLVSQQALQTFASIAHPVRTYV